MLQVNSNQSLNVVDLVHTFSSLPIAIEVQNETEVDYLLSELSPETPWYDRQIAARKLGYTRSPEALPALLAALPSDPFWMVRCAIIQALEMIGDPEAIPTLRKVSESDGFQAVRTYAKQTIDRLS